jgi:SARP family transcriptional regulator, regulator of embCAB operon
MTAKHKMDHLLRIFICGRLAVAGPALIREATLPGRQGRRLWAYLVLNRRRPVARDELAEAIWGDDVPDGWDSVVSGVVSRLRTILAPVAPASGLSIEGKPGCYILRLPAATFVDYERARSAIHGSDVASRRSELAHALSEARVAMEIAARGFLAGEEGPWIQRERRLLTDIQVRAFERTVEAEIERDNPDLAEQEARLLIRLDPLRESGYRLLMRALDAGGNQAEAVRIMTDCREMLRDQVGTAPSRETERLFHQIVGS